MDIKYFICGLFGHEWDYWYAFPVCKRCGKVKTAI